MHQRAARNFVNYCLGCHSAQYVRWNRVAEDLGIGEAELQQYLMFTGGKPFDTMHSAMPRAQAIEWQQARGGRSGRVAWQFVTDLAGRQGIAL